MAHFRRYSNEHYEASIAEDLLVSEAFYERHGVGPRFGIMGKPKKGNRPRRPTDDEIDSWIKNSLPRFLPSLTGREQLVLGYPLTEHQERIVFQRYCRTACKKKKHAVRQNRRKRDFLRREADRKRLKRQRDFEIRLAGVIDQPSLAATPSQAYLDAMAHDDVTRGRSRVLRAEAPKPIKPIFEAIGGEG